MAGTLLIIGPFDQDSPEAKQQQQQEVRCQEASIYEAVWFVKNSSQIISFESNSFFIRSAQS